LELKEKNISGKNITPFLLQRVNELTNGESLKSNISLILNNAKIGAQISLELNKLVK
jgi:pseudouridine-5'-phosphate glycosidase